MARPLAALILAIAFAPALAAQERPTPAVEKAVAGTWRLDQSRSDTIGADPLAGAVGIARGFTRVGDNGDGGGSVGGGGGGRGGGRRGRTPIAVPTDSGVPVKPEPDRSAEGRGDPHLALVIRDMNPGNKLIIAVNDSAVSLASSMGQLGSVRTDGRKRQSAQMDGSIIEVQAQWKGDALQIISGVANVASLKREFKASKDGTSLDLKETLDVNGRKVDKTLYFTRE